MTNEMFDQRLKFIETIFRDYRGLIIILPTVLGSISQIIGLLKVDLNVSYLKFFSISQIVPDSLYFLMAIITAILLDLIIVYLLANKIDLKTKFFHFKTNPLIHSSNNKFVLVYTYINLFALVCNFFNAIFFIENKNDTSIIAENFSQRTISNSVLVVYIFVVFVTYMYGKYSLTSNIFIVLTIGIFVTSFIVLSKNFLLNTSKMSNNANFKHVNELIKTNLNVTDPKIIYFNDQYIFYDISEEEEHEIYIYKLENIFY